jgi:hypothetical protein
MAYNPYKSFSNKTETSVDIIETFMPQNAITPILPREVQIDETQRCTNNLQQNSRKVEH